MGSLNVRTVTVRGRVLVDMVARLECCVCRRVDGREQSEIVGEAANCSVVAQTSKNGMG